MGFRKRKMRQNAICLIFFEPWRKIMEYRRLGQSGLKVSPLCLGSMQFGWSADEPTAFQIMDTFIEAGGNFIDTADAYSAWIPGNKGGES